MVVQAGTTAFGYGETVESAIESAQEWLDTESRTTCIPLVSNKREWDDAVMHDSLVVVECSELLYTEIQKAPTVVHCFKYGELVTEAEDEQE